MTLISARSSVSARSFGHLQSLNGEHWIAAVGARLVDINTDEHRNVYFTGYDTGNASYDNADTYIWTRKAKVSPYGGKIWDAAHENSNSEISIMHSDIDSDGNTYAAGSEHRLVTDTFLFFIAKFDSSGSIIWQKSYARQAEGRGVAVDGLGNLYVLVSENGNTSQAVARVDSSNGSFIWFKRISGASSGEILVGNPSGGVFLYRSSGAVTYLTSLNVDGDILWSNSNVGILSVSGQERRIYKPAACGNYDELYVVNNTELLTKYSASTGQPTWSVQITGLGLSLWQVFVNDSGEVYVAGEQEFRDSENDLIGTRGVVLKFNSSGALLWQRYADISDRNGVLPAYRLLVTHVDNYDNMYFASGVIGSSLTGGTYCFVVKLPGDGSKSQSTKFFVDIARYEYYHTFVYTPSAFVVQAQTPAAFTSGAPALVNATAYSPSSELLEMNTRGPGFVNWRPI